MRRSTSDRRSGASFGEFRLGAGAGDIIRIELDPRAGHEQAGHRPAVVLSPFSYNGLTGLLLCAPMPMRERGYRFERLPIEATL